MDSKLGNEMRNKALERSIEAETALMKSNEQDYLLTVEAKKAKENLLEHDLQLESVLVEQLNSTKAKIQELESSESTLKLDINALKLQISDADLSIANSQKNISYLIALHFTLDDTNHNLMHEESSRFSGHDWYLPTIDRNVFKDLAKAMAWDETQKIQWDDIYSNHQLYHENLQGNFYNKSKGYWQFYAADGLAINSPRKKLLDLVKIRIDVLKSIVSIAQQDHALTQELDKKNAKLNQITAELVILYEELNHLNEKLENTRKDISKAREAYVLLSKKQDDTQLFLNMASNNLILFELEFIHHDWQALLTKAPDINEDDPIEANYNKTQSYLKQIDNFCSAFENQLLKSNYTVACDQFNAGKFSVLLNTKIYKQYEKRLALLETLILEKKSLVEKYESLNDDYFSSYKQKVDKLAEITRINEDAIQKEQLERKIQVDKYLGDEQNNGYLNDYLTQRNAIYWFSDLLSYFVSFFLSYPFGYITEKQKRTDFINDKLRPALLTYKTTGSNIELEKVLSPIPNSFFKPRSRDEAAYHLTLESILEELRKGLLICHKPLDETLMPNQLEEKSHYEEESNNYFTCGCF